MEIKRCLLTKTTNENSTFAIYPKTSADLVVMGQEEDAITVKERFEQIKNDGIWDNNTFTDTKMYPKAEGCGDEENHPDIDEFGGGWWDQVKGNNVGSVYKPLIQHQRRLIETPNMDEEGNKTSLPKRVAPTLRIQNYLTYNHKGFSTDNGYDTENICRIVNEYHELIADGKVLSTNDKSTPNFTPVGIFSHNRFKGAAGMCALFGRVKDVYYTNEELKVPDSDENNPIYYPASKSCAAGFYVQRLSNYNQGVKGVSYSIGLETWTENLAQEDGLLGTEGYYGDTMSQSDRDLFNYKTWTCGYHLIGSGRRPVTAGIFIEGATTAKNVYNDNIGNSSLINKDVTDVNGDLLSYNGAVSNIPEDSSKYTYTTIQNGMYNGIVIGSSAMLVGGKPSPNTVGINMASWTNTSDRKRYGYSAIRIGYAPRFLSARGSAYFEAPSFKFLNRNGNMPVAITCRTPIINSEDPSNNTYYRPSLVFKQGANANSINGDDNLERPNDEPVAYMAYNPVPSDEYFVIKSNNSLKFVVNTTFKTAQSSNSESNNNLESDNDIDMDDNIEKDYYAVYKYQNDKYFGNLIKRENYLKNNGGVGPTSYPTLGSNKYPWQTIYLSSSPMIQVGDIYNHSTTNNNDYKSVISINNNNEPYFANSNKIMKAWEDISISDLAKCIYTIKRTNNPSTYDNKVRFILNVDALRNALDSYGIINSYSFIQNTYDIGDSDGSPSAYSVDYNQIFLLEMIYNRVKNINRDNLLTNITNAIGEINNIGEGNSIIAKLNDLESRISALENA